MRLCHMAILKYVSFFVLEIVVYKSKNSGTDLFLLQKIIPCLV